MPDFAFYTDDYKGNQIAEGDFERLALRAEMTLRRYERAWTITYPTEDAKPAGFYRDMTLCAVAEVIGQTEAADVMVGAGMLGSASIGSVSASFDNSAAAEVRKSESAAIHRAIKTYAVVYRGAASC